jgi:hypothetical protein
MKKSTTKNSNSQLHINESLSLEEQIAQRAYELWHHRKCQPGSELDDWLQAEREVTEWHHERLQSKAKK